MALKFFSTHTPGGSGSSKDVKVFEIRLDSNYIVFRGGEDEAASVPINGSLVLCLAEAMAIHHVKLTLSGIVHMSYVTTSTSAMTGRRLAMRESTFFEKTWIFKDAGKGRTETLPSDNYQWNFDTILDGALPESVEGSKDAWIVYRLKAEICRKRGKDIVVRKPIRVVRTLGAAALELSHEMSVDNIWPNKIEYSISTPSKAVVFGSFIQVDFKLIPLLKGLTIGNITTQLKEEQEFVLDPEWGVSSLNGGVTKDDRVIVWDMYKIQSSDEQIIDEAAEGYQFSRYLELPKSLSKCLQDCNVKGIKVRHKLKFNVQLHNPDGHVSELRANLPISLSISPSLPLNENNDLVDQTPQATRAATQNDIDNAAPPLYGQHTLDTLYSEVDPSGYRTPGMALSLPGTPYSQSRNISSENLASLDAITNSPGHVSATALQYRLQNLRVSDRNLPIPLSPDDREQPRSGNLSRRGSNGYHNSDYFSSLNIGQSSDANQGRMMASENAGQVDHSGHSSRSDSAPISRQSSAENTQLPSPGLLTVHFENLAKVPSYSTAVRTPAPRATDDAVPTYGAVISENLPTPISAPQSAHLHTSPNGSWSESHRYAATSASASSPGNSNNATQSRLSGIYDARRRRSLAGRG